MKNKKTRRFKIRYIVFGLLGVMALAALVFMRFGGFGTGENVNPEEFLAYAEPVENITVPESAKIIALGEATHGNAEFQQLKLEVFKLMVKNNGVRAFALEGDYGGCEQVNRYIHGGEGTAQEAAAAIGFSIYRTEEMAELISYMRQYNESALEGEDLRFYGFDMQRISYSMRFLEEVCKELECCDTGRTESMWLCRRSESTEHNSTVINMQLIKFINSLKIFEKDIPWCYNLQKQKRLPDTNEGMSF